MNYKVTNIRRRTRVYSLFAVLLIVISSLNKEIKLFSLDYVLYGLFLVIASFSMLGKRGLSLPKRYFSILFCFLSILFLNIYFTNYHVPIRYYLVGVAVTCLPFIHFVISYNQNLSFKDVSFIIDKILNTICVCAIIVILETLLFRSTEELTGFLKTQLFMIGFIASLCNQGVILSLASFHLTHRQKYKRILIFLTVMIVLTNQLKAIGSLIVIYSIYFLFMRKGNTVRRIGYALIALVCVFQALMFVPKIHDKVLRYSEMYGGETAKDGIARVALYYTAVEIANDYFPFGSGQGTYGSIAANLNGDDRIYDDYGISGIWGLSSKDEVDFRMDAYGSSVLGEQGYLSTIFYIGLLFFPFFYLKKQSSSHPYHHFYLFISGLTISTVLIESLTLALMNRFAFIFIYSGLSALIIRIIDKNNLSDIIVKK